MIYHAVEQNTDEWRKLRLGVVCASDFEKVITPKGKLSIQAPALMYRLLAEWVTGEPVENAGYESPWMKRGHELEPAAVLAYEMLTDRETSPGGFITTDDGTLGCSPDRLVGEDGDAEIKCPLIHTQVQYALTGIVADEYKTQLQGRLMIHGRDWVEIFSYHPSLSLTPIRVHRDEPFITATWGALEQFMHTMLEKRLLLEKEFGPFERTDNRTVDSALEFARPVLR